MSTHRAFSIAPLFAVLGLVAGPSRALAQERPPAPSATQAPAAPPGLLPIQQFPQPTAPLPLAPVAPAPGTPPDLVRLRGGGLLRGTIVESEPGRGVVITLATGETRHLRADEVESAGPATTMPVAPRQVRPEAPPAAPPRPNEAFVRFEADSPNISFYARTGRTQVIEGWGYGRWGRPVVWSGRAIRYAHLCTAPCERPLPPGSYRLALSEAGGRPIDTGEYATVRGPATVSGSYNSRHGTRVAGLITTIGSIVGGGALMLTSFGRDHTVCDGDFCRTDHELNDGQFFAGLGVLVVGTIVGGVLMAQPDRAHITVTPLAPAALGKAPAGVGYLDRPAPEARGLTVTASF